MTFSPPVRRSLAIAGVLYATAVVALGQSSDARFLTIEDTSGEPVVGLVIGCLDGGGAEATERRAATDAYGRVALPQPCRRLRVNSALYGDTLVALDGRASGVLTLRPVALPGVEVVAAAGGGLTGQQTSRLSVEAIVNRPALLGEPDALRALQRLPGIKGAAEGQAAPAIRGGSVDQTLIIVDGATLYSPTHFLGYLGGVNVDAVKDIEVYTGGFPARYGDRLSGVVAVTTRQGRTDEHFARVGVGFPNAGLLMEGPAAKGSYLVTGRVAYPGLALSFGDATLLQGDIVGKLHFPVGRKHELHFSTYLNEDRLYARDRVGDDAEGNELKSRFGISWGNQIASLRLTGTAGAWLTEYGLVGSRYGTTARVKLDREPDAQPEQWRRDVASKRLSLAAFATGSRQWGGVGLQVSARLETAGYGIRERDNFDAELTERRRLVDGIPMQTATLGANVSFPLTEALRLHTGARAQALHTGNDYAEVALEPRVSLDHVRGRTRFSLAYDRMRQPFHRLDPGSFDSYFEVFLPPSDAYPTQVSDQVSLLAETTWRGWRLRGAVYGKRQGDLVFFPGGSRQFTDLSAATALATSGIGRAYGIELSGGGYIDDHTSLDASYTYARALRDFGNGWEPYRFERPHQLKLDLVAVLEEDRWSASASFTYQSGIPVTEPFALPNGDGLLTQTYRPRPLYTNRYTGRAPDHHHLDLGLRHYRRGYRYLHEWTWSLYNVYGRANPAYVSYRAGFLGERSTGADRYQPGYDLGTIFRFVPGVYYQLTF